MILLWEGSKPTVIIEVQRGNCLADLIAAFIYSDTMNKVVHINRKLTNRELEVEFWGKFNSKFTLGTNVYMPYLRYEYQRVGGMARNCKYPGDKLNNCQVFYIHCYSHFCFWKKLCMEQITAV